MTALNNVTVLGSGVLGGQIAWHNAFRGKRVVVYDISAQALEACQRSHRLYADIYRAEMAAGDADIEATQSRLACTTELQCAVGEADLVIEAVPEDPAIKTVLYRDMAPLLPPHTVVATNSSTLLPRDFAEHSGRPDKFCALHYANLIWRANLIEIMAHPGTSDTTLTAVTEFVIDTGMAPIPVQKEHNGYILNAWLMALLGASQTLITNGIATPEEVDRTFLIANKGCAAGPMGLIDVIGMNTVYNVLIHWGGISEDQQMLDNAAYIKTHFIDKGHVGTQSGQGYYSYPDPAYMAPDFQAVPARSAVPELVAKIRLG